MSWFNFNDAAAKVNSFLPSWSDPAAPAKGVFYIGVWRNTTDPPLELSAVRNLKGILKKFSSFESQASFFFREVLSPVAKKTEAGATDTIVAGKDDQLPPCRIHVYARSHGICAIAITDPTYPDRTAHTLLFKVCGVFQEKYKHYEYAHITEQSSSLPLHLPELKEYIETWQDPKKADPLTLAQMEADETLNILNKTMGSVLERGEKVGDLFERSENLSTTTKMFYKQTVKQNSCCVVM